MLGFLKGQKILLSSLFLHVLVCPPDNSNHNEEITESPNDGDKSIQDEECYLNLRYEDELLFSVAVLKTAVRLLPVCRIVHSLSVLLKQT